MPLHLLTELLSKQIDDAGSLKCHGGKVYVSQLGTAIQILNSETLTLERTIEVPGINEILIDGCHIYGTDLTRDRLLKMDTNGAIIASIGTRGCGPRQFDYPNGIRLSKDDELYVCDSNNHRIQVFTKDLNLNRIIGPSGDGYSLNWPTDFDFDGHSNLYVVDHKASTIQVLTPKGQHVRSIGEPGKQEGKLHLPGSVALYGSLIYITDLENSRVSVFKTSGEFVAVIGEDTLSRPECIAVDDDGFFYISDNRCKLVKF